MPDGILETALRVLSCYTTHLYRVPHAEDLARLQSAFDGDLQGMSPDALAVEIIRRELQTRRLSAAG